uniref:DUF1540 domain-containing protein n=1 Tax=Globodera pallida TaxID=36090 RepID=A0A183BPS1_GLOPA
MGCMQVNFCDRDAHTECMRTGARVQMCKACNDEHMCNAKEVKNVQFASQLAIVHAMSQTAGSESSRPQSPAACLACFTASFACIRTQSPATACCS